MTEIRRTGNYEQWIRFFLQAFHESAKDAIAAIDKLSALHNNSIDKLKDLSARQKKSVMQVFNYLKSNPIIDIQKTATAIGLAYNTVSKAISILERKEIPLQTSKSSKAKKCSKL